jgi:chromosome segregation ATPase
MTNDARGSSEPSNISELLENTSGLLKQLEQARNTRRDSLSVTVEKLTQRSASQAASLRQKDERISQLEQEKLSLADSHAAQIKRKDQERAERERKLGEEIKSLKGTIATLTTHIETMEKSDAALRSDLKVSADKLANTEEQIEQIQADYEAQLAQMQKELDELDRESKSKIQRAITTAEQGARRLKLSHQEKVEELHGQIKTLNLELGESRSTTKALRDENGRLANLLRSMQNSLQNLLESEMTASDVAREFREQAATSAGLVPGIQEQVSQERFRKSPVPMGQFKTEA